MNVSRASLTRAIVSISLAVASLVAAGLVAAVYNEARHSGSMVSLMLPGAVLLLLVMLALDTIWIFYVISNALYTDRKGDDW